MKRELFVGDIVANTDSCIGILPNEIGIVYEEYDLGDDPGVSILFSGGQCNKYSISEQVHLIKFKNCKYLKNYQFKETQQLINDFNSGYFDNFFKSNTYDSLAKENPEAIKKSKNFDLKIGIWASLVFAFYLLFINYGLPLLKIDLYTQAYEACIKRGKSDCKEWSKQKLYEFFIFRQTI